MGNSDLFTKKLKELHKDEVEYSAEFFEREFGNVGPYAINIDHELETADIIRESSAGSPQHTMSPEYSGTDVDETWLEAEANAYDGELAVDVFQNDTEVIITSTVAGVTAEDLDIDMNGDMITIKGMRRPAFSHVTEDQYMVRECYWGGFSRTIILPVDILPNNIKATLENGILTIILPKAPYSKTGKITVEEK